MPPPYADDPAVLDTDDLWRRIPPWHFVPDENLGYMRPSSAAFEDDQELEIDGTKKPLSAYVARIVYAAHLTEADVLAGHEGFGLVTFKSSIARQNNLGIAFEPAPLPGHVVVFGPKTGAVKKRLYRNSAWVVPPPAEA